MTLATNLDTLLDDALVEILTFVEVRDILALRKVSFTISKSHINYPLAQLSQVCKKLRYVSMLRPVWLSALLNLVLGHGYPPYAANKPIMDMNASELEKSAIGIVRLAHRISQPTPTATRTHIFTDRLPNAYITQVLFLPGRCGRWVISVTAGQSLTFWEILDNPIGALLAGSWGDEGFILDVVTNRVPSNDGILALTHRKNGYVSLRNLCIPESLVDVGMVAEFFSPILWVWVHLSNRVACLTRKKYIRLLPRQADSNFSMGILFFSIEEEPKPLRFSIGRRGNRWNYVL